MCLCSGHSPLLQCTVRDPSWMIFRAHLFLTPPGTLGTINQVKCLSSLKENTVVHTPTDKVCRLLGHSFFSSETSQPCSDFWVSLEWQEKPAHPNSETVIPVAFSSRKSQIQMYPPSSYQWGPLSLDMFQYLLSSSPSVTWCVTSNHGIWKAACK